MTQAKWRTAMKRDEKKPVAAQPPSELQQQQQLAAATTITTEAQNINYQQQQYTYNPPVGVVLYYDYSVTSNYHYSSSSYPQQQQQYEGEEATHPPGVPIQPDPTPSLDPHLQQTQTLSYPAPPPPQPLIIQHTEAQLREFDEEIKFQCTSWRVSLEANNLSPWKTIPYECKEYVKDYMMGRGYLHDLERVNHEAGVYAKAVDLIGDGKDVWVFDIDETLLSNLPYYAHHGFGLEVFDHVAFDKWVEAGMASALESSLKLYKKVLDLGFKVVLLTGRTEQHRSVTVENLTSEDRTKMATIFKSEKRNEIVKEGYRIHGNSGDQWSDLLGFAMSIRSFKLPNPMYYIP
ncbi:hypothetical protein ACFE04_027290 [Oxalis oulophora]